MKKSSHPNPQGKGLVPILGEIEKNTFKFSPPSKNIDQVTSELFTSIFILNSEFSFKVTAERSYFLYFNKGRFSLSLVSPKEIRKKKYQQFVATCIFNNDMTWTLELSRDALSDKSLMKIIEDKKFNFEKKLKKSDSLKELLPHYIEDLRFNQRVYAKVLANSLKISMYKSGILELSYHEAKKQLS